MNIFHCTKLSPPVLQRNKGFYVVFLLLTILTACAPSASIDEPPYQLDIQPPEIQSAEVLDERSLRFEFDEEVFTTLDTVEIEPEIAIASADPEAKSLIVRFSEDQTIGSAYTMRLEVADNSGNILSFLYRFTGWNPRVPELLINEINPKGSKSTPDCVELFALTGGNIGGLELVIGTEENLVDSIVFPAIEILAGEYIVVHTKPEGLAEEIDELEALDASGGRLASENARDFWMRDKPGLPGSNGAVTLYRQKGGSILDAVIWSDRDDQPDDERLGWTSASFPWAKVLGLQGEWEAANDIPLPSEALAVGVSTATRSLCRSSQPVDSNSPRDWHTVPTSGQTFGAVNKDEVYNPPTK